jgi:hypothetical protein
MGCVQAGGSKSLIACAPPPQIASLKCATTPYQERLRHYTPLEYRIRRDLTANDCDTCNSAWKAITQLVRTEPDGTKTSGAKVFMVILEDILDRVRGADLKYIFSNGEVDMKRDGFSIREKIILKIVSYMVTIRGSSADKIALFALGRHHINLGISLGSYGAFLQAIMTAIIQFHSFFLEFSAPVESFKGLFSFILQHMMHPIIIHEIEHKDDSVSALRSQASESRIQLSSLTVSTN